MKPKRSKYEIVFEHLFSFRGYKLFDVKETKTRVLVILKKVGPPQCPNCGSIHNHIEEKFTREVRDLNLRQKQCYIQFEETKIRCSCGYRGIEYLDFIRPYSRCTKSLESGIAQCAALTTLTNTSLIWDLDWKTVKDIDIRSIQDKMIDIKAIHPTMIGVDEIAYKKGHDYLTIVRDIAARRVIWIGFKRKTETLDAFFKELGPEKSAKIEVYCMDMWDPYIGSVKKNTEADIVFDKFHALKKVHESIDKVRKRVFSTADDSIKKRDET